jgi:hypothetical protein
MRSCMRRTAHLWSVFAVLALAGLARPASAVVLDGDTCLCITLNDGTPVTLLPEAPPMSAAPQPPPLTAPSFPAGNWPVVRRLGDGIRRASSAGKAATPAKPQAPGAVKTMIVAPWVVQAAVLAKPVKYYYLPTNLRLSRRPDGTPEFLFLKYTTENRVEQGGAQGGLLHFLMEWGLTASQESDLRAKLKQRAPNADLVGAAPLDYTGENGSFAVVSAVLSNTGDKGLTCSMVTSGKAPLMPGDKAAVAALLSAQGAQLLDATFSKDTAITDIDLVLDYACPVLMPAARGRVTINWARLEGESKRLSAEYRKWQSGEDGHGGFLGGLWDCLFGGTPTYSYSYDEMQRDYKFLIDQKVIDMQFDVLTDDERVQKLQDAFFDYFLKAMAEPQGAEGLPPAPSDNKEKEGAPDDIRTGDHYTYNRSAIQQAMTRKTQTFELTARYVVKRPIHIVANIASCYDAVRDNPRCVSTVNLNDPFFQHRDINFVLDLDAKEMFDEGVNYVTVNVRKKRTSGNLLEKSVTIDPNYLKEHGVTATVTYARGEDANPDVYEYQAQWSLRGGLIYPTNPTWEKASWEGVTLSPPVVPRTIDFEGNLEDMQASGITRATAQIRYLKFGQEVEENLHISPAGGQALVSKRVFTDRGSRGYVCRLILNHKDAKVGKLVLPWQPKVNDDYIYATIPDDLLTEPKYREAAKTIEQTATQKVLDQFKELVGGATK